MSARILWPMLLVAALSGGPAHADVKADYQDGVAAAKKGDWAKVQRLMQASIAAEAAPNPRMRVYGTTFIPYVPKHYLGLAEAHLDDCAAALQAFKDPATQSIVDKLPERASEQSREATRCQAVLLAAAKPPPQPEPTVAITEPVVDSRTGGQTAPPTPTPTVVANTPEPKPPVSAPTSNALSANRLAPTRARLARIDQQIQGIQQQLQAAPLAGSGDGLGLRRELDGLTRLRADANTRLEQARTRADAQLLAQLDTDAGALERKLGMLGEQVNDAREGLLQAQQAQALQLAQKRAKSTLADLDEMLARATREGVAASASAKAAQNSRLPLQQAGSSSDRAAIDRTVASASKDIAQLEATIAAAPKPAPEPLRALVGLYLQANYADAARWNQIDGLPASRDRAQALLLRAAARWHLYVRGGEQEGNLIAAVNSDLREAKRLDSAIKPNPQVFSPKLITLFANL
jgi:hypothetical protein